MRRASLPRTALVGPEGKRLLGIVGIVAIWALASIAWFWVTAR